MKAISGILIGVLLSPRSVASISSKTSTTYEQQRLVEAGHGFCTAEIGMNGVETFPLHC